MKTLEEQVADLRDELRALAERVRLDAVASAFLAGAHEIREGDCFLRYGDQPTQLDHISSDGKWTYDSHEWNERDPQRHHRRLYTIEEVAEIVAKLAGSTTETRPQPAPTPATG